MREIVVDNVDDLKEALEPLSNYTMTTITLKVHKDHIQVYLGGVTEKENQLKNSYDRQIDADHRMDQARRLK